MPGGNRLTIRSQRFCNMVDDESGAIKYAILPLNFSGPITIAPYLDGTIHNRDANYAETFWNEIKKETSFAEGILVLETTVSSSFR